MIQIQSKKNIDWLVPIRLAISSFRGTVGDVEPDGMTSGLG